MADTKITALTALTAADPASDVLPIVDISDTTMAASGTTKKISVNNILGSGGTATLASASITGDLTASQNIYVPANTTYKIGPVGSTWGGLRFDSTNQAFLDSDIGLTFRTGGATSFTTSYQIGATGISTWSVGGTTAMTLNATGLGVGATVYDKITALNTIGLVTATTADFSFRNSVGTVVQRLRYTDSDASLVIGSASAISYAVSLGGNTTTRAVTIDASSNVGIGVTPSAWQAGFRAVQVGSRLVLTTTGSDTFFGNNFYNDGAYKFINADFATYYDQTTGKHVWGTSTTSGAVNDVITWNAAMTLDASGRFYVGTTSSGGVNGFSVVPDPSVPTCVLNGSATTGGTAYLVYSAGATANRFYVTYAGTVFATNTTISAISDARFKENVQDIDIGLGAILALKPRKFDWKAGKGKDIKGDRGFIAQEFEQVFPQLVDEWADPAPEGEAPYKSVRQDLIPVLVKAIQELTARVQTLEAK